MRPDVFRSEISVAEATCTVALFGELDLSTAAEAESAVDVARAAAGTVILDLRGLQFMDARGLRLIMRLDAVARRDGFDLRIMARDGLVQRLLWLTGIDVFVNVVDGHWPDELGSRQRYAVIATDVGGLVTVWNSEAERLYGWSALEVLGRPIMEVTVGPEDRRLAEEIMSQVQRTGHWEGEFEVRSKHGDRFAARVHNALIKDDHGNFTGFLGLSIKTSKTALTLT